MLNIEKYGAIDIGSNAIRLLIATPDEAGLMARLAGAISLYGGQIMGCRAHTLNDGMALDTFTITCIQNPLTSAENAKRLQKLLKDAITGRLQPSAIEKRLSQTKTSLRQQVFNRPATVRFDNGGGPNRNTIMEVSFTDRPGQQFRIAQTLSRNGIQIHMMKIVNYGERTVDVFYITDLMGYKVSSPERLKQIKTHLAGVLS